MAFNFSEKEYESTVMVVDALNLAFRWKHKKATEFAEDYINTVKSLATSYMSLQVIIAADKGSSAYRKNIFPDYKGNRKEKYESQSEEEKEYFQKFFQEYENALAKLEDEGFLVLRYDKVEADDIAAYLVKRRFDFFDDRQIWLMSSDKDWDLLISENVSRFSYVTRKETTKENWDEHYPCRPDQYISFKALIGDKGDHISGVPGIGPARAQKLLETYDNVFDLYDAIPIPGKAKFIQNLNDSEELLLLNVELMDLVTYCEEAIGYENVLDINKYFANYSQAME